MERLERLAARFNLVVTTAKNLGWVVGLAALAIASFFVFAQQSTFPVWAWSIGSAAAGASIGFGFAAFLTRLAERREVDEGGFRVKEYAMEYKIGDPDPRSHVCVRKFKLKATKNEARIFSFNYNWSGRGQVNTQVKSTGHLMLGELTLPSVERCVAIYVGRHDRGDELEVEIEQNLYDEQGAFGHFILKVAKQRIDRITLAVEMPPGLGFDPRVNAQVQVMNRQAVWVKKKDYSTKIARSLHTYSVQFKRLPLSERAVVQWRWEGTY